MIRCVQFLCGALALVALAGGVHADAPHVYAITKARIVTAAGPPIAAGTVVIRNDVIESVGASATVPAEAQVIDGTGLTVYPGLVDMSNVNVLDVPAVAEPRDPETREEVDRWRRSVILRPEVMAARHVKVDAPELTKLATAGITSVLAVPVGEAVRGHSALINVMAPEEDPQIGDIAGPRQGLVVLRTPVALHVGFGSGPSRFRAYPESLMGVIAFVRQAFLDAQHYSIAQTYYERVKGRTAPPVNDPSLAAMQPAIAGTLPVAFEADTVREIRRALKMATELKLQPIISGARESGAIADELKARNVRVVLSLNYPTRPQSLPPNADEPLRVLRGRADAPKAPAGLERAGVLFAFGSNGLKEPADFVRNAAKAVKAGLPADVAIRALTINAAQMAGVADRLGSIQEGKIANVIVTDGDLFDEKTTVRHVFIDGRLVKIDMPEARRGR